MESIQQIKSNTEVQARRLLDSSRHNSLLASDDDTREVIVRSFRSLVDYLENRVSRTEVVNQLESIGTPDVFNVVTAVDALHKTLRSQEPVDLSEVTNLLRDVLVQAKQIPKQLPKPQEQQDYTKQIETLASGLKALEKAVKAQKLIAEAPIVNVPETTVNVEAPDLSPLQGSMDDVTRAVKKTMLPQEDGAVVVHNTNGLITERFDRYEIKYDSFDDEVEPQIVGIDYYLGRKKVAALRYTYDSSGNLLGGKRV